MHNETQTQNRSRTVVWVSKMTSNRRRKGNTHFGYEPNRYAYLCHLGGRGKPLAPVEVGRVEHRVGVEVLAGSRLALAGFCREGTPKGGHTREGACRPGSPLCYELAEATGIAAPRHPF